MPTANLEQFKNFLKCVEFINSLKPNRGFGVEITGKILMENCFLHVRIIEVLGSDEPMQITTTKMKELL